MNIYVYIYMYTCEITHLPLLAQKCILACTFLRRTTEYAIEITVNLSPSHKKMWFLFLLLYFSDISYLNTGDSHSTSGKPCSSSVLSPLRLHRKSLFGLFDYNVTKASTDKFNTSV